MAIFRGANFREKPVMSLRFVVLIFMAIQSCASANHMGGKICGCILLVGNHEKNEN